MDNHARNILRLSFYYLFFRSEIFVIIFFCVVIHGIFFISVLQLRTCAKAFLVTFGKGSKARES
ncbi:unnamed protein product [Brassica oleracea var. botrytis]|uniref:(rape) hypothetical protein n=1 Tax=Brassica napus TaxID=3708 RepID=A0A078HS72_BRANA|nr:unnamed protein product [Brassica napus]CDY40134.1 BnaC06g05550D [Brassica napus]